MNIMDYSLLLGIHDLTRGNSEQIRDRALSVLEVSYLFFYFLQVEKNE